MKRRPIILVLLMLLAFITMDSTSDARGTQYTIAWDEHTWKETKAFMRNGEWYIPVKALEKAYHLNSSMSKADGLELHTTSKTPPYVRYQPIYYQNKVITLMYHNIEKHPSDVSFISPGQLEEQIVALRQHGFRFIGMDDYVRYMNGQQQVPDNAVLLTFDDGYETFYTEVYPLLKRHHLTATNFVIVSSIDDRKQPGRAKLSWVQMRAMMKDGFRFYSHTFNSHAYASINTRGVQKPMLTRKLYDKKTGKIETREQYRARIRHDLMRAEKRLKEELGNKESMVAFPYGAFNTDVLNICKSLGIDITFTVKPGINDQQTRNGFRINAGNQNIATKDLVESLINQGDKPRRKTMYRMSWNQIIVPMERPAIRMDGNWYLPLREVEQHIRIKASIDNQQQQIMLFPGK
ncbi:polysaccharide deacetylase family protein [Paenibacillus sp. 1001270B_150601_E10]|uniref:polysaccharide deacetylase family protein n=1 Tax=Paenibacillus sp. 1001270B_150601_E10 TaxID=2787079 RepID=UPI00189ECD3E|nr:polysaccharide deacetylase family protein [Paenibacillus sp. 1001270B_150601_E10]